MASPPPEVVRLIGAPTPGERDAAWSHWVDTYSKLLLHVARSLAADHDDAMDAYTRVLEQLRADDFARLRSYVPEERTKFSTWLVVVVRRICVDHFRHHYGRPRASEISEEQTLRRRLQALAGEDVELSAIAATTAGADANLERDETLAALDDAVAALDASDRLILELRFADGLSAAEIARLLRLATPFHVYRRLDAITASLRSRLRARGVESALP